MKKLFGFLILILCFVAGGTDVTFNLTDSQYGISQTTNATVTLQAENISQSGAVTLLPLTLRQVTGTNGSTTFTNLYGSDISGFYHWTIAVYNSSRRVTGDMWVQSTNMGTVTESEIDIVNGAPTYPAGTWAWSAQASDVRYGRSTNSLSNYVLIGQLNSTSNYLFSIIPSTNGFIGLTAGATNQWRTDATNASRSFGSSWTNLNANTSNSLYSAIQSNGGASTSYVNSAVSDLASSSSNLVVRATNALSASLTGNINSSSNSLRSDYISRDAANFLSNSNLSYFIGLNATNFARAQSLLSTNFSASQSNLIWTALIAATNNSLTAATNFAKAYALVIGGYGTNYANGVVGLAGSNNVVAVSNALYSIMLNNFGATNTAVMAAIVSNGNTVSNGAVNFARGSVGLGATNYVNNKIAALGTASSNYTANVNTRVDALGVASSNNTANVQAALLAATNNFPLSNLAEMPLTNNETRSVVFNGTTRIGSGITLTPAGSASFGGGTAFITDFGNIQAPSFEGDGSLVTGVIADGVASGVTNDWRASIAATNAATLSTLQSRFDAKANNTNANLFGKLMFGTLTNVILNTNAFALFHGQAAGGYFGSGGNWTNRFDTRYTITALAGNYYVQSNGVTLYASGDSATWTPIPPGVAPAPISGFGGIVDLTGFDIRGILASTNLTAQILALAGTNTSGLDTNAVIALIAQYGVNPTNGVSASTVTNIIVSYGYMTRTEGLSISNFLYTTFNNATNVTPDFVTNTVNGLVPNLVQIGTVGGIAVGTVSNFTFNATGSNYIVSIVRTQLLSGILTSNLTVLENLTVRGTNFTGVAYLTNINILNDVNFAGRNATNIGYVVLNQGSAYGQPADVMALSSERNGGGHGGVALGYNNGQIYGEIFTTVLGGSGNDVGQTYGLGTVILGGTNNLIAQSGPNSYFSVILGGANNDIRGSAQRSYSLGSYNSIASGTYNADYSYAFGPSNTINRSSVVMFNDGGTRSPYTNNTFIVYSKNGVGINTNRPGTNGLQVLGNIDSTVGFSINGVPIGTNSSGIGGSATNLSPWPYNINAALFSLTNAHAIEGNAIRTDDSSVFELRTPDLSDPGYFASDSASAHIRIRTGDMSNTGGGGQTEPGTIFITPGYASTTGKAGGVVIGDDPQWYPETINTNAFYGTNYFHAPIYVDQIVLGGIPLDANSINSITNLGLSPLISSNLVVSGADTISNLNGIFVGGATSRTNTVIAYPPWGMVNTWTNTTYTNSGLVAYYYRGIGPVFYLLTTNLSGLSDSSTMTNCYSSFFQFGTYSSSTPSGLTNYPTVQWQINTYATVAQVTAATNDLPYIVGRTNVTITQVSGATGVTNFIDATGGGTTQTNITTAQVLDFAASVNTQLVASNSAIRGGVAGQISTNTASVLPLSAPGGTGGRDAGALTNILGTVTPYQFGAVGDGTDDTAAIQAAINYTTTNSSTRGIWRLFLAAKISAGFTVSSTLNFPQNGCLIEGSVVTLGATTPATINYTGSGRCFQFTNDFTGGYRFRNITLSGPGSSTATVGMVWDLASDGGNPFFDGVQVINFGSGVLMTNVEQITVRDSAFGYCTNICFGVYSRGSFGAPNGISSVFDRCNIGAGGRNSIGLELTVGTFEINSCEMNGTNHSIVLGRFDGTKTATAIFKNVNCEHHSITSKDSPALVNYNSVLKMGGGRMNDVNSLAPSIIVSNGAVKIESPISLQAGSTTAMIHELAAVNFGSTLAFDAFINPVIYTVTNEPMAVSYRATQFPIELSASGLAASSATRGGLYWSQRTTGRDSLNTAYQSATATYGIADILKPYDELYNLQRIVLPSVANPAEDFTGNPLQKWSTVGSVRWRQTIQSATGGNYVPYSWGLMNEGGKGFNSWAFQVTTNGDTIIEHDLTISNNITFGGAIAGNGSALTSLSAANLTGTIADARLSSNVPILSSGSITNPINSETGAVTTLSATTLRSATQSNGVAWFNADGTMVKTNDPTFTGTVTANLFSGSAAGLSNNTAMASLGPNSVPGSNTVATMIATLAPSGSVPNGLVTNNGTATWTNYSQRAMVIGNFAIQTNLLNGGLEITNFVSGGRFILGTNGSVTNTGSFSTAGGTTLITSSGLNSGSATFSGNVTLASGSSLLVNSGEDISIQSRFRLRSAADGVMRVLNNGATAGAQVQSGSLISSNFVAMATNYISANFTPIPGMVIEIYSNNWKFAVSDHSTNALYQIQP